MKRTSTYFLLTILLFAQAFSSPVDDFCQVFDTKKTNNYTEMLKHGDKVLKTPQISAENLAKVHARLASINYYLGNYSKVKEHALFCKKYALDISSSQLVIRSLYLLSAYYRGKAQQTEEKEEADRHFDQAREFIQQALVLVETLDNPLLTAKVLFNAGAAYADDPGANAARAIPYYQRALELLPKESTDTYRTLIRLSQAQLKIGKLSQAWETLSPLFNKELDGRIRAHLYYAAANFAYLENNRIQASIYAKNALTIAKKLGLSIDQKRIEKLQEKIALTP